MKILILYRHFWPDSPPYASMLRSIARTLVEAGHEVTIWAEEPCYKPSDRSLSVPRHTSVDGIRVERLARLPDRVATEPMRLLDKLLFVPRLLLKAVVRRARGARYDLVWTATIPPVIQGWAGRTIAGLFGAQFLYHCQDLYPELAGHMNLWRQGGLLYRIMARIERRTRSRADLLVTLSADMAAAVRKLGNPRKLLILNNFPLEDFTATDDQVMSRVASPPRDDGKIQLIFAGNLGNFQGLEAVVEAMRLIEADCPKLEFLLMGEGKALPRLQKRAADLSNVRILPHLPYEEARRVIADADIGLVSVESGIQRYAFPSKTLTYLELGLPILTIVDTASELANMVTSKGLGWVSAGRDCVAISETLLLIANGWESRPLGSGSSTIVNRRDVLHSWVRALAIQVPARGTHAGREERNDASSNDETWFDQI
ncbi:glycosyltransferase family 4 protein [Altererythrobacter sp. C41]|uniref:glycosyltransferase family 4 protein n=1 Tax=Altererythrobacter sp. C41 TaxID=2806021 RepID=UPI001933DFCC|nr:glycosyltransferase family 4 protein [Altererythrobacter sp. C41]MBM0171289.1 glycosyltransferase family 4 protein [Altererythrobacter sp. C41]